MKLWVTPLTALAIGAAPLVTAQTVRPGRVASSIGGQAGQRSTAAQAATGAAPLERLDTRIANRVQSRIRNRIDPSYDPQANAASPFNVASDRVRTGGSPRRR